MDGWTDGLEVLGQGRFNFEGKSHFSLWRRGRLAVTRWESVSQLSTFNSQLSTLNSQLPLLGVVQNEKTRSGAGPGRVV